MRMSSFVHGARPPLSLSSLIPLLLLLLNSFFFSLLLITTTTPTTIIRTVSGGEANNDHDNNNNNKNNPFEGIPGLEDLDGTQKFCKRQKCPNGFDVVPKWPLNMTSFGCSGIRGDGVKMATKDKDEQFDELEICCDLKHACYQLCGTTKTACDNDFLQCTKDTCNQINEMYSDDNDNDDSNNKKKKRVDDCNGRMNMFHMITKFDQQCTKFNIAQKDRCSCYKTDGTNHASDMRTHVITQFYELYNPTSIDKVHDIMDSIDNEHKMASLLYKLIKKHRTQVIQRIDPPPTLDADDKSQQQQTSENEFRKRTQKAKEQKKIDFLKKQHHATNAKKKTTYPDDDEYEDDDDRISISKEL